MKRVSLQKEQKKVTYQRKITRNFTEKRENIKNKHLKYLYCCNLILLYHIVRELWIIIKN